MRVVYWSVFDRVESLDVDSRAKFAQASKVFRRTARTGWRMLDDKKGKGERWKFE